LGEQVKQDYRQATLDAKTRALLDFAVQVTRELHTVRRESIEALRQHGWSDSQIHDAVQVISVFNYYTRLAETLGIDPEDFMGPHRPTGPQ